MTKIIASLALLTASFAVGLGNFWFTYGIWPKSWTSYAVFWVLSVAVTGLLAAIGKAED